MQEARFPKRARLLKPGEYRSVFDRAERSSDACFTVLARAHGKHNSHGHARLGLAISKKRAKLSVERNRLKRIIRESFRQHQAALPAADFIVLAGPECNRAGNNQLFNSLEKHWSRLNKRCARS